MIKKIRTLLEYDTYPLWIYEDEDFNIDNDAPLEWRDDKELEDAFMAVTKLYSTFFIDNPKEFSYIGPQNPDDISRLKQLAHMAMELLYKKNNGKYVIQNDLEREINEITNEEGK